MAVWLATTLAPNLALLVDDDPHTQSNVVLSRTRENEICAGRLMWRRHQQNSQLLVAAIDDVPINLGSTDIDPVVEPDVESAAESHREAGFVRMEIGKAKHRPQVWAINIDLLISDPEQSMRERFQACVSLIVFDLYAAEKILDR